jgi:hypothetical protein
LDLEASNDIRKAIESEITGILEIQDAVADLVIAEGVHQVLQGNQDRAAATLDAFGQGGIPTVPEIVRTPKSGITITHRLGWQFKTGLSSTVSPLADVPMTPRAEAEPALNDWLKDRLPDPGKVGCWVELEHDPSPHLVTQKDLLLQPIDLLYLLNDQGERAMAELNDRVLLHLRQKGLLWPNRAVKIKHLEPLEPALGISFFELSALVNSLRSLVLRSRALQASDVSLPQRATPSQSEAVFMDKVRIETIRDRLLAVLDRLDSFVVSADLSHLPVDEPAARDRILNNVDTWIEAFTSILEQTSRFGIPQTNWGFMHDWRRRSYESILEMVRTLVPRWEDRLRRFDDLIARDDALPSDNIQNRLDLLMRANLLISTKLVTDERENPRAFRALLDSKRVAFVGTLNLFRGLPAARQQTLSALHATLRAISIDEIELTPLVLDDFERGLRPFAEDLHGLSTKLQKDLHDRLDTCTALLSRHDARARNSERVTILQEAAKVLLGEEFKVIPEFQVSAEHGAEWQRCLNDSRSGLLLQHQLALGSDFPVDDWLYGLARVREKVHHLEQVSLLSGAFNLSDPTLTPIQFPFKPNDHWLGLEFPSGHTIDGDTLLYTAHYQDGAQLSTSQVGLLLDEWTEVLPSTEETTGLAFHFDRPNSEPPQVMLLVTPPDMTEQWQWQDLVDALNETLELAKKRAVEPTQLDQTPYAQFLPATMMATSLYQMSIFTNLAINNDLAAVIKDGN